MWAQCKTNTMSAARFQKNLVGQFQRHYRPGFKKDCSNSPIPPVAKQICEKHVFNTVSADGLALLGARINIDGLAQHCSNCIANALELLQSCTKPSICR